jgi:hypothetical protein
MEAGQAVRPIAVAAHIHPVICRQPLLCAVGVRPEICFFQASLQGNVGMVEICATKTKKEREKAEITWELLNRIGK